MVSCMEMEDPAFFCQPCEVAYQHLTAAFEKDNGMMNRWNQAPSDPLQTILRGSCRTNDMRLEPDRGSCLQSTPTISSPPRLPISQGGIDLPLAVPK